ncbi:Chaperone protein DnaJ [Linum grandiflorum]
MDGGGYRVEAERWLTISEKLLNARDLQGAKTFAIRARESDPRLLHFADQIIAIADTLLAAEIRVKDHYGAATDTHDYYALLQLPRLTHSMELIATQYRKLALLLNPTRNRLAFADQAFRLVSDAWMLFSNPSKKAMYDSLLQPVQLGLSAAQFANQGFVEHHQVLPQSPVSSSSRLMTSRDGSVEPVTNQWVPVSTQSTRQPIQEYQFTDTAATQHFLSQPTKPSAQQKPTPPPPPPQPQPPPPPPPQQHQPPIEPPRSTPPVWISQSQQPVDRPATESSRPAAPKVAAAESSRPVQRSPAKSATPKAPAEQPPAAEAEQQQQQPSEPPAEYKGPTFWTACPYCYVMYEYPKVYEECALRCQTCKRGFHAVTVQSPPVSGKDTYFCCWGFFPLGYSGGGKKFGLGGSNWSPFSAMFSTPLQPGGRMSSSASAGAGPAAAGLRRNQHPPTPTRTTKDQEGDPLVRM